MIVSCITLCSFITWSKVIFKARLLWILYYTRDGFIQNKFLPDFHNNVFDCQGFITILQFPDETKRLKKTGVSKIFNWYYGYEKLGMNFKTTGKFFSNFSKLVLIYRMNDVF